MWVVLLMIVHFILFVKAVSVGGFGKKEKKKTQEGKGKVAAKKTPWILKLG